MDEHIHLHELILLALYLGAPVFAAATLIQVLTLRRQLAGRGPMSTGRLTLLTIASQTTALALSVGLWPWWPFELDVMCGPVSWLAVASEIIVCPVSVLISVPLRPRSVPPAAAVA